MTGTSVAIASKYLLQGKVVGIPTETVYGLAASMYQPDAVKRIFDIKNRPVSNPLILHVADLESLEPLVKEIPPQALQLAAALWPGPLTMVFNRSERVPDIITGGQSTVAIRIPAHPLTLELLQTVKQPLAAPSANKYNYISPVTATAVEEMLGEEIPYILDGGPCQKGIESTIVAFRNGELQLLRQGAYTEMELRKVTGKRIVQEETDIRHPGMYKKHYSPHTPVIVMNEIKEVVNKLKPMRVALISFFNPYDHITVERKVVLSPKASLEEAAQNLYASLYQLDKESYDMIIAEKLPDTGLGRAMNDRLSRAAVPY